MRIGLGRGETKNGDFTINNIYKVLEARPTIAFPLVNIWGVRV